MDLLIVKFPHGLKLQLTRGAEWWSCGDVLAVFPRAGHLADDVLNAFAHDDRLVIRAPLAAVLAAVAHARAVAGDDDDDDDDDESGSTTEYGTLCSGCRRERETSPPPPQPVDPSAPRLTEAALARHTRARSRSPARAEDPSAEGGR